LDNEIPEFKGYDVKEERKESKLGLSYKWIALSNTTLGALMASIDGSILMISLPAIFNGLGVDSLVAGNISLLLWLLLGYTIVTCVTVVTIGRLSDMFGRVKLYNIGFAIFSAASVLVYASSYLITGDAGILAITLLRLLQGLGGGFLFANSAAILTDAFPPDERGKAMGFNQIAFVGGSVAGLLIGGFLAAIDWHLIFLISVPVGIAGTIWAYVALHEIATIKKGQRLDVMGNITFALSIALILLSMTYGLLPYGTSSTGWTNPLVDAGIIAGVALLALFVFIEMHVKDPMFKPWLFKIRDFATGNTSMLLAGMARGGLQFMLIVWLQGIWLPLHGISFTDTPLLAAEYMMPLVIAILLSGPVSGYLSDRYGARLFSTAGMAINAVGFVMLATLQVNFSYLYFAAILFCLGIGQGLFSSPNTAFVMNSVPPEYRGVASGMRATLVNLSFMFSLVIFFSLLITGISSSLPAVLYNGLVAQNVSSAVALQVSRLPPTAAIFAAMLGENPMKAMLPQSVISALPPANAKVLLGTVFFPTLLSKPFMNGIRMVFYLGAAMALIAAACSALPSRRYEDYKEKMGE
jgi:MFS family permease